MEPRRFWPQNCSNIRTWVEPYVGWILGYKHQQRRYGFAQIYCNTYRGKVDYCYFKHVLAYLCVGQCVYLKQNSFNKRSKFTNVFQIIAVILADRLQVAARGTTYIQFLQPTGL